MNIFEYFAEEEADIERKLAEVTENYEIWTREQVFDRVKEICDAIWAHLKKQSALILNGITPTPDLEPIFAEAKKDHLRVEEEIGQLTQVHVDEPNYDEALRSLFNVLEDHIKFSKKLYAELQAKASKQELDNVNAQLNNMVLHSADFNTLPSS